MIAYVKKTRSERESLALGFEILVSCYVKIKHNLVIQHCQIKRIVREPETVMFHLKSSLKRRSFELGTLERLAAVYPG